MKIHRWPPVDLGGPAGLLGHFASHMGEMARRGHFLRHSVGVSHSCGVGPGACTRFGAKIDRGPADWLWSGSGWFGGAVGAILQVKQVILEDEARQHFCRV